jgi:hypothetical protein
MQQLPEDLKNALSDNKNFEEIYKIAESFGVDKNGDGVEIIDSLFDKTISGELPLNQFTSKLEKQLVISKELSTRIFDEINTKLFSKYKVSLSKIYQSTTVPIEEQQQTVLQEAESKAKEDFPVFQTEEKINKEMAPAYPKDKKARKVDDILTQLSKELDKEKKERQALNDIFNNQNDKNI